LVLAADSVADTQNVMVPCSSAETHLDRLRLEIQFGGFLRCCFFYERRARDCGFKYPGSCCRTRDGSVYGPHAIVLRERLYSLNTNNSQPSSTTLKTRKVLFTMVWVSINLLLLLLVILLTYVHKEKKVTFFSCIYEKEHFLQCGCKKKIYTVWGRGNFNTPIQTANNISRAECSAVSFCLQNGELCRTVIHGAILCAGSFLSLYHVSRISLWLLCPCDRMLNQMPNLTWALCWPSLWWGALSNLPAGDWLLLSGGGPPQPYRIMPLWQRVLGQGTGAVRSLCHTSLQARHGQPTAQPGVLKTPSATPSPRMPHSVV